MTDIDSFLTLMLEFDGRLKVSLLTVGLNDELGYSVLNYGVYRKYLNMILLGKHFVDAASLELTPASTETGIISAKIPILWIQDSSFFPSNAPEV